MTRSIINPGRVPFCHCCSKPRSLCERLDNQERNARVSAKEYGLCEGTSVAIVDGIIISRIGKFISFLPEAPSQRRSLHVMSAAVFNQKPDPAYWLRKLSQPSTAA